MQRLYPSLLLSLVIASSASSVTMDWTVVGNPGNACDPQPATPSGTGVPAGCFGAVPYSYRIGTYEVTNAQYAEFLNAVAVTDPHSLYNPGFAPEIDPPDITRSGVSGGYSYGVVSGRENWPTRWVTFSDTMRFANWLHNGQPSGNQNPLATEIGAYTLTQTSDVSMLVTRNPGATVFIPSENEWYKAAYYDAETTSYFGYPAGSDTQTSCSSPTGAANHANCAFVHQNPTDVGSYEGSPGPYGTFDQGGNVFEWNEGVVGSYRGWRGGGYSDDASYLAASVGLASADGESYVGGHAGFRLGSMIPEPSTGVLVIAGLLGLAGWRRGLD